MSEWVRYDPERDSRTEHQGQCSHGICSEAAVVVQYERDSSDWSPLCAQHARAYGWSGIALALSESELGICCQFAGEPSNFQEDYASLQPGSTVTFATLPDEYDAKSHEISVKITALVDGHSGIEEAPGPPPSRLFEAEVLCSTQRMFDGGEPAFGILFPNGFASVCDGDPAGDYTDRRINAGLAYWGSDR
jgi:hypothetical protein